MNPNDLTCKVALAHDYLTQRGGAERVALAIAQTFPSAPLYTTVYEPNLTFSGFRSHCVRPSILQSIPIARRDPRSVAPLLPIAWLMNPIRDADVVVASSSGWAHAANVPDGAKLVVYCHNTPRWLYQPQDYFTDPVVRRSARALSAIGYRRWDQARAKRADLYVANSTVVAKRIRETYGIDPAILHPPVLLSSTPLEPYKRTEPGFFVTVARSRGYKNVRSVIDAFAQLPSERLLVVGQRHTEEKSGSNVEWTGVVSDAQLRWIYSNARALISVSYEDFGLTPIEANSFGTPAIALRAGGFLDTVSESVSGILVESPTPGAIVDAVRNLPSFLSEKVTEHSQKFSADSFSQGLRSLVAAARSAT